jgi:hypothetical protein
MITYWNTRQKGTSKAVNGMDSLIPKEDKRGINKTFVVATLIALAVIAGLILFLSRTPPANEQMAQLIASAYHAGAPEFADLSKDIIIATDDRTVESPTGLGTISMYIYGKIRNKGSKTIDILEVNVAVVTQFNEVLKEKSILVVPVQQPTLPPDETIPITLALEGFSRDDDRANIRWKVTAIRDSE